MIGIWVLMSADAVLMGAGMGAIVGVWNAVLKQGMRLCKRGRLGIWMGTRGSSLALVVSREGCRCMDVWARKLKVRREMYKKELR